MACRILIFWHQGLNWDPGSENTKSYPLDHQWILEVFFCLFFTSFKIIFHKKIDSDFSWSCSSLHKTSHRSLFAVIQSYFRTWDQLKSEENHRVPASHSFLSFSLQPQLLKWRHDSEYLILLLSHSFPSFLRFFIPSPSYCLKIFYLV